mgnify:FL=1
MKKLVKLISAALISTLCIAGCSNAGQVSSDKPVTLRMSYSLTANSPCDVAAQKFKELVSERTEGRINIELYPNCGLSGGDLVKAFEMLISGDIDIHGSSPVTAANFDTRFNAFWLPWLFDDVDTLQAAIDGGLTEEVSSWSEENNMKVLSIAYAGARQLSNSKREVKTVEDMKDLVIRIPSVNMFIDMFKELGASPVAMDFSEVYTASQQGTIDGQENPLSTYASAALNEVQKYVTIYDMVYDTTIWFMNSDKFSSFSQEDQAILTECAEEAAVYYKELVIEEDSALEKSLADEGVTVTRLTEEELAPFREKAEKIYEEYRDVIGADVVDSFMAYAGKN